MHKVVNCSTRGFPVIINAVGFPLKTRKVLKGDAKEETTSKNINLGIKETPSREEAVNSCINLGCLAGLMKFLAAIFRTKRNPLFLFFFFSTFARLTWLLGALSRGRVGIICHANFLNPLSLSLLDRPLTGSRWFCYISQPVLLFIDRRLNSISRMCLSLTWISFLAAFHQLSNNLRMFKN